MVTTMTPLVLEWVGVFASTASVSGGDFVIRSPVFETHGAIDLAGLIVGNLGFLLVVGVFAHGMSVDRRAAQRALRVQAWHLRKLLPNLSGVS